MAPWERKSSVNEGGLDGIHVQNQNHSRKDIDVLESARTLHTFILGSDQSSTKVFDIGPVVSVESFSNLRSNVGEEKGLIHGLLGKLCHFL